MGFTSVDSGVERVYKQELKMESHVSADTAASTKSLKSRSQANTTYCQVQQTAGDVGKIDICDLQGIAKVL
jgi:hypothetical protein